MVSVCFIVHDINDKTRLILVFRKKSKTQQHIPQQTKKQSSKTTLNQQEKQRTNESATTIKQLWNGKTPIN